MAHPPEPTKKGKCNAETTWTFIGLERTIGNNADEPHYALSRLFQQGLMWPRLFLNLLYNWGWPLNTWSSFHISNVVSQERSSTHGYEPLLYHFSSSPKKLLTVSKFLFFGLSKILLVFLKKQCYQLEFKATSLIITYSQGIYYFNSHNMRKQKCLLLKKGKRGRQAGHVGKSTCYATLMTEV